MTHKPKTVLIVDDDEGMRDTLTAILKREYRVLRVSSGEAALPILNREDVDLMLLDVRLPGISGFEFVVGAGPKPSLIVRDAQHEYVFSADGSTSSSR